MNAKRIILAGGTGYLGQILGTYFLRQNYEVIVLTRSAAKTVDGIQFVSWDGETLGPWKSFLEDATAVINLSGRTVNCRYTPENRRQILDSRVHSTRLVGQAIAHCARPPRVWLNSSTATIYKHSIDKPMDENSEMASTPDAKDEFSVEVAMQWERAFNEAVTPTTRKVALRTTMVMGSKEGTVFRVLTRLVKFGLGGTMGSGKQYVAWIHEEDFCRAIEFLIEHDDLSGGFNIASPFPMNNRDTMKTLQRVCGVPFGLPAARWMLEIGAFFMRTETELIIKSRRVIPGRLQVAGFQFKFPNLAEAAKEIQERVKAEAGN